MSLTEQLLAIKRYVASFRKGTWQVTDYPLKWTQHPESPADAKFKSNLWSVQIINWWHVRGDADTQEGVLADLAAALERHRQKDGTLPRPGRGRKLELTFAPQEEIVKYEVLAQDFFTKIMHFEFSDCFITDESGLSDFPEADEEYLRRIGVIYSIHPSEFEDLRFVTIFKTISSRQGSN